MRATPQLPAGVAHVTEVRDAGGLYVHPQWRDQMPWLVQGITGRDGSMSLFTDEPVGTVIARWTALRAAVGCRVVVHARQVHRAHVHVHHALPPGLVLAPDADGHATRDLDALLAVSVADCVPISIVAPHARAIALLHAGWRGVAAGILERGLALVATELEASLAELLVHFGPAICGECYEVGDEVVTQLGLTSSAAPPLSHSATHIDLRAALATRAIALGMEPSRITVSAHCTRHGDSPFYSHRGGCRERQISVLALHA